MKLTKTLEKAMLRFLNVTNKDVTTMELQSLDNKDILIMIEGTKATFVFPNQTSAAQYLIAVAKREVV